MIVNVCCRFTARIYNIHTSIIPLLLSFRIGTSTFADAIRNSIQLASRRIYTNIHKRSALILHKPPNYPTATPPWYTADLTALAACVNPQPPPLPDKLMFISTPLNHQAWQLGLNNHPDQIFASYLLDGIAN